MTKKVKQTSSTDESSIYNSNNSVSGDRFSIMTDIAFLRTDIYNLQTKIDELPFKIFRYFINMIMMSTITYFLAIYITQRWF